MLHDRVVFSLIFASDFAIHDAYNVEIVDDKILRRIKVIMSNSFVEENQEAYSPGDDTANVLRMRNQSPEPGSGIKWELTHKQVGLLMKLYAQLPKSQQRAFIIEMKEYAQHGGLTSIKTAVLTLANTGNVDELIEVLIDNLTSYDQYQLMNAASYLNEVLLYQGELFTPAQLDRLYDWADDYFNGGNRLAEGRRDYGSLYRELDSIIRTTFQYANVLMTEDIAEELAAGFNPEINTDQAVVVDRIKYFGFPHDLTESLEHINNLVQDANTPAKHRDCLSAIRAFNERLMEQIARSLDPASKIDGKDSEAATKFFVTKKLVSGDMAALLTTFRHFLSNDGVHRLKSRREDARIAKNLNIEITLYLFGRLQEVAASPSAEPIKTA